MARSFAHVAEIQVVSTSRDQVAGGKRERFAQGVFRGLAAVEAAVAAGYSRSYANASKLLRHPDVVATLKKLGEKAESEAILTVQEAQRILTDQARGVPKDAMSGAGVNIETLKAAGKLHQITGVTIGPNGVTVRLADSQGAIGMLAKMKGWNAAEKHEHKVDNLAELSDLALQAEAKKLGIKP